MKPWIKDFCVGGGYATWLGGAVLSLLSLSNKTSKDDLFGWAMVVSSIVGYYIYQDSKEWE